MVLSDSPTLSRLAELWVEQKVRGTLTEERQTEFILCMNWLVGRMYSEALLKNYSIMASISEDLNWQHDICGELDKF